MKNEQIIFTICARNYYGLAQVLKASVLRHNPCAEFVVFIADGIPAAERGEFGADAIDGFLALSQHVTKEKAIDMAFKYNLTEFCTAIKPFCFKHLFEITACTSAMYLDPDIFVYAPLDEITENLSTASIVVTPHIIFPSLYEGRRPDKGLMATGVFNLGFLLLKRSTVGDQILQWWAQRLLDQCFIDNYDSLFTDQKWMDFIPSLFPSTEICCLRHAGANVAPWNFHERKIVSAAGESYVTKRTNLSRKDIDSGPYRHEKLLFIHFSGFDYKGFCRGQTAQYNIDGLELPPDLESPIRDYMHQMQLDSQLVLKFLGKSYVFASYDNGIPILSFHRRLYRAATEAGLKIEDPFSTASSSSFFSKLKRHRLLPREKQSSLERTSKRNLSGLSSKMTVLNMAMRFMKFIIGFENYVLLLRFMRPYSRVESQLHLIDRKYNGNL